MGLVLTYYLIDDELIEKSKGKSLDLLEYVNDELLKYHDYKGKEFWRCGIVFGTGVKAWNPTIELLNLLDNSEDQVIGKIITPEKFGGIDDPPYLIKSIDVEKVWIEMKKFSVDLIEKSLSNCNIISHIKNISGYRMNAIENKPLILLEFKEIFTAFYQAKYKNKGIALNIS